MQNFRVKLRYNYKIGQRECGNLNSYMNEVAKKIDLKIKMWNLYLIFLVPVCK